MTSLRVQPLLRPYSFMGLEPSRLTREAPPKDATPVVQQLPSSSAPPAGLAISPRVFFPPSFCELRVNTLLLGVWDLVGFNHELRGITDKFLQIFLKASAPQVTSRRAPSIDEDLTDGCHPQFTGVPSGKPEGLWTYESSRIIVTKYGNWTPTSHSGAHTLIGTL